MVQLFLLRWFSNTVGLWIAARLLVGVKYEDFVTIVIAALILSIVNALIRPIVVILSIPAIILTLGLFTLVINSLMLFLVAKLYPSFTVESFGAAVVTVIILWLVNHAINTLMPLMEKKES